MSELCDDQNDEHAKAMRPYRGFPGSRPLPEHQQHDQRPFEGRDPQAVTDEYYDRGFDVFDFDDPIEDIRLVGPHRLLIRFGRNTEGK